LQLLVQPSAKLVAVVAPAVHLQTQRANSKTLTGMIIAQITDSHIDPQNTNAANRIRDLERCVRDINQLAPLPDVVVHTGDVVHQATAAKYGEAVRILRILRCPLLVAVGNSDDRVGIRATFASGRDLLPDTPFVQYSIDDYPVRLVVLDTKSATSNMGDFCGIRADNLRMALAEDRSKPTALFMHHPPFEVSASKYKWQFEPQQAVDRMRRALDGQSQVVRGFCGHCHRDAAGNLGAVLMSSAPSVAIELRLGDFPDELRSTPVYQIHRFDARRGFVSEQRAAK
jgi:3',5'-cyclic AMP phosphodiesterase CpdA